MKCSPCNGSGLLPNGQVDPLCQGLGHDGVPEPTVIAKAVKQVKKTVKKVVKKVTKKKR